MIDLTNFLKKIPFQKKNGNFSEEEIESYKNKIPSELYEFFIQEGRSVYGNNFFWIVSPSEYHEVLDNWGLNGKECFAFLRSSFGCIEFFSNDNYYQFNPHDGTCVENCGNHFDMLFNLLLCNTTNLEMGFCYDLHVKNINSLPILEENEMYTLVPAFPLGGSFETSRIEVVKMNEQLDILAQLYNHKTTK